LEADEYLVRLTSFLRDEREVVGFEEVCSHGSPIEMDLIYQEVFLSDVGQRGTTYVGEYSDEDSTFDLGSMSHEVSLQHDVDVCSCESHHLIGQLKVHEDMIVASMRHLNDTHIGGLFLLDDHYGTGQLGRRSFPCGFHYTQGGHGSD
jgi:hypothetical protein